MLATIHESYEYIPLRPMILQLHRNLYKFSGSGISRSYKNADNVIAEADAADNRYVHFQPVPAWETPEAVEQACKAYDEVLQAGIAPC